MSNTLKSALGPDPSIQAVAWLTLYGVACFAVVVVVSAVALAPVVAALFG